MNEEAFTHRYFTSYSGVKLPLKLVNEIPSEDMSNRNTYFQGSYDELERLRICRKIVYGETELEHRYDYYDGGALKHASIEEDDETTELSFDEQGRQL